MDLEKVENHQIRRDLYQNEIILPEGITELDRTAIRQIISKELNIDL